LGFSQCLVWIFLVYLICFDCCFSNMRLTTRKLWTWKMKSEFWNIQHILNKSHSNGFHRFEKKWNSFYEQLRISFKFIYFNSNFSQKVFKNAYTPLGLRIYNEGLFSFKSAVSSWPDLIKSQFPSRSGLVLNPRFSSRSGLVLNPSFPRDLIYIRCQMGYIRNYFWINFVNGMDIRFQTDCIMIMYCENPRNFVP